MGRLIIWSLAGLILIPAAWAGDDKDKKNGDEKVFKIEGKLTKDDPADKIRKESPQKVHEYKMKAGSVYVVKMIGKQPKKKDSEKKDSEKKEPQVFDTYLRIEDSAGNNLAEDDDSGGWPNAQIIFKAPKDDAYRIIATAYSSAYTGTGEYTLTIREASPKELDGPLGVAYGESLRLQFEARHQSGDKKADYLLAEAEAVLKQVGEHNPNLDKQIKEQQFALKHLTVSRPAMEIEGEDLDGKKFKLSDYRGKVVVIDFWGHW
ncbi:MAG: redoxin domain-containing protein [Planctomycetes bacterium]|nr:redoxin domain-containing protein [Planctomycetota bacterium]